MPKDITIKVTSRCDKNCYHCCNDSTTDGIDMDYISLLRILKNAKDNGFTCVNYTGGEPFLYDNNGVRLNILIECALSIGLQCTVITGGATVNPIYKDVADKLPPAAALGISFNLFHKDAEQILVRTVDIFRDRKICSFNVTYTTAGRQRTLEALNRIATEAFPGTPLVEGCVVRVGRARDNFSSSMGYPNCCGGKYSNLMFDEHCCLLPCSSVFSSYNNFQNSEWKNIKPSDDLSEMNRLAETFCKTRCPFRYSGHI